MKTTLKHIGVVGFILSGAILITAVLLKSAPLEVLGIAGFILSPVVKSMGD